MKFVSDFFALILFFVVYFAGEQFPELAREYATRLLGGIVRGGVIPTDLASLLLAIAVAIVVFAIQIIVLLAMRKKIGAVQWVSFVLLVVFGGASIYFHDDNFIKWKVTVLYWLFAIVLIVSNTLFGKNLIRMLMEPNGMILPDRVWQRLNLTWIAFFSLIGVVNLYIAFQFSRSVWVTFKSFGLTAATIVFALVQGFVISHYLDRLEDEAAANPDAGLAPAAEPAVTDLARRA